MGLQQDVATERRISKEAKKNKLPSEQFGNGIMKVMRLCRVGREADLPEIWGVLAKASTKQHRTIIQQYVDDVSEDLAGGLSLVVTPFLAKKIATLEFTMGNKEVLEAGMHPFVFSQHSAAERHQAMEVAGLYDFVTGQHANAGLADAQLLLATDTVSLPQMFSMGRGMITRCMVWFATFLGSDHDIVEDHQVFLQDWLLREAEYELIIPRDERMRMMVPTLFVRWFQIRLTVWLDSQWRSPRDVQTPDFHKLFTRIELGEAWEPTLPLKYDRMIRKLNQQSGGEDSGGGGPIGGARRQEVVGDRIEGGDGGGGGGAQGDPPQNRIARNTNYKEALFAPFARLAVRVRDVLVNAQAPPPISPHDPTGLIPMCVTFHVKAMCNDRCRRAVDHGVHTEAQDASLVQWCTANYVLP